MEDSGTLALLAKFVVLPILSGLCVVLSGTLVYLWKSQLSFFEKQILSLRVWVAENDKELETLREKFIIVQSKAEDLSEEVHGDDGLRKRYHKLANEVAAFRVVEELRKIRDRGL